jgi:hypothetical protein
MEITVTSGRTSLLFVLHVKHPGVLLNSLPLRSIGATS